MFTENIKNEDVNLLECRSFEGEIILVDTLQKLNEAAEYLQNKSLIGFDTEARPRFTKGSKRYIALLQLATNDKAFLIRINIIGLQQAIIDIFENKNIIKIGLGITDDMRALKKLKHFNPACFIDLQQYTNQFGIKDNSLKKIAAIVLGFRISKSQRLSNWEKDEYSNAQKLYAATDAWACFKIYQKLNKINFSI
ncbi:MAG: 3'-5' exonuclease domain-containing protein 2 [Prevotellaceae bacterium]|jgi:ribonuclease D|nr:3'-5' exonuclease domain-containing protein 2 [Prevotellaceae bacterium]